MSAEPDDDGVPLETYGGQLPEHEAFAALDLSPNAPISDDNAIPGIDQDPAPIASGSGLAPDIAMSDIAPASDMHASISLPVAVLVAAPVTLAGATNLVEPASEFERGRLAGLAAATAAIPVMSSQPPMVARVVGLPSASPPVSVRVARGLFTPPLGSAQGAVRPLSLGPSVAALAVSETRNLLDPEFEQIHASAAPPSANLSGPRGVWNAAPVFGPQRQTLAARPTTRQGLRPNPPWIMGGLAGQVTSASPGGSTAPSLTDVPAEVLFEDPVDNMDMRAHVKDPTKYLSVITQYCRTRE